MFVYFHIPFCAKICPYCSFYKHSSNLVSHRQFVDALLQEVAHFVKDNPQQPTTIYFGGGTPSLLSIKLWQILLQGLRQFWDLSRVVEITVEANPTTFKQAKADLFYQLGINRISLGVQSFHQQQLTTLGRNHSPEQAREAISYLQQANIPIISIDLMFNTPGETQQQWLYSLNEALHYEPQHISCYNLTYEEDTEFFTKLERGDFAENDDANATFFLAAEQLLSEAGYLHYETSNYAKPSYQSHHNQAYWQGKDYIGFGPSAISTIGFNRYQNIANTKQYIALIEKYGYAKKDVEVLTDADKKIEKIALGLRTTAGICLSLIPKEKQDFIHTLTAKKMAQISNGKLQLIARGKLYVDSIALELI